MIPERREEQSFEQHQTEMAAWCGYDDAAAMNADHDGLHRSLCGFLGVTSLSMCAAAGKRLTGEEKAMADLEEDAVLYVQRFMRHARKRQSAARRP
jgi:hypothetical protein